MTSYRKLANVDFVNFFDGNTVKESLVAGSVRSYRFLARSTSRVKVALQISVSHHVMSIWPEKAKAEYDFAALNSLTLAVCGVVGIRPKLQF